MKNGTSKHPSGISTEQGSLNFFSDSTSADEVRQLLGTSISQGKVRSEHSCSMWSPVIPPLDQTPQRNN